MSNTTRLIVAALGAAALAALATPEIGLHLPPGVPAALAAAIAAALHKLDAKQPAPPCTCEKCQ